MKKSELISLVREVVQIAEKKKGGDGKACWKGYRYAGTKNGKDVCIKVKGVKKEIKRPSVQGIKRKLRKSFLEQLVGEVLKEKNN